MSIEQLEHDYHQVWTAFTDWADEAITLMNELKREQEKVKKEQDERR